MNLIDASAYSIFETHEFVYYISNDQLNQHDRFYKTDLRSIIEVDVQEYAEIKFGNAWRTIHSASTECIKMTNGEYLTCTFVSSIIYKHNVAGKKTHQYNIAPMRTGFDTIYSIAMDKYGYLWIAQPSSHYIGQYDLNTEQELFKLGGDFDNPTTLNHPEQVRTYGDYVYISDMGNNRVCRIHLDSMLLEEHLKFDEPVWEYAQFNNTELVRLQSGLYVI